MKRQKKYAETQRKRKEKIALSFIYMT